MNTILTKLFSAADNHAEDSGEPDHAVGDLQDLLREAWGIMTASQKMALLEGDAVEQVLETGGRDEEDVESLTDTLHAELADMEAKVTAAGYRIMENPVDEVFFWETNSHEGLSCACREDAVEAAFVDLQESADGTAP